jgi:ferric-dicitrate binding protein FerR (iron transport regulator)
MKRDEKLIDRYLSGQATEVEVAELDARLADEPKLRQAFYRQANAVAALEEEFCDAAPMPELARTRSRSSQLTLWLLPMAAALLCVFLLAEPRPVATLVSNENAAWESALPTTPGSELQPGLMLLKSGVATIRFRSGAEVTLEAPSQIELQTPMRGKLLAGTAVINVPESAQGFVLDTPEGYAVDHGTAFVVSVGKSGKCAFEVLEGEISLHAPDGRSLHLNEQEAAAIAAGKISRVDALSEGQVASPRSTTRVGTGGNTASVVRCDKFDVLHPDFLMVKTEPEAGPYDRRAYLSFAIENPDVLVAARLRLNLVPSGLGDVVRLEPVNRFAVYGLPETPIAWKAGLVWSELPDPANATLLGTFDIPRSQQRGAVGIDTPELLAFLKANPKVILILTRETPERQNRGLVHAFASDSHPEASGPTLELSY